MADLTPTESARLVETGEAKAWANFYSCTPMVWAGEYRVVTQRRGSMLITMLQGLDSWFFNRVMALGMEEPATESVLDQSLDLLSRFGCRNYMVHLSPFARPPELREWLKARGIPLRGNWAKTYRGDEPAPVVRTDLRIELIGQEWASAFGNIALESFEMPPVLLPLMTGPIGKPGWFNYLGFDGDRPVCTASMFVSGEVAWLGMGSTLASHRGRGGQSAMFARRISDGLKAGCKWFVSETGEDTPESPNPSYHNMLRAGFKLAYMRPNYVRESGAA